MSLKKIGGNQGKRQVDKAKRKEWKEIGKSNLIRPKIRQQNLKIHTRVKGNAII